MDACGDSSNVWYICFLLPVVAAAELLDRVPARKDVPGEMVVQVDETGRDNAVYINGGYFVGQFHLGSDRDNLALPNQDGSFFDDAAGRDQSAAQGQIVGRRLG